MNKVAATFWVNAFVRIPLGIVAAVILIVGRFFSLLWWLLRLVGRLVGRVL